MPRISVIVPVYKVEQYLPACVDSILGQTFEDFELILVDDGSPDGCGLICDDYARKDARVRVIHQQNQGLSGARNSGIDVACGAYITFIDSDDVVTADYLAVLLNATEQEQADISVCTMQEFWDDDILELGPRCGSEDAEYICLSNQTACIWIYEGSRLVPINAWGKLFHEELFASMRFPVGRLHEDQAVIPLVCYQAKRIVSIDAAMYCYRVRSESITKTTFSVKRYDDLWAIENCIRYFEERGEQEILKAARDKRMRLICVYAIYARHDHVTVPEQYRIPIFKALLYLRRHVSNDKYAYYLGKVNMNYVRWHEYVRKAESIVRKLLRRKNEPQKD